MDPTALLALIERCAPAGVPHAPLAAIIRQASGGEALLLTMGRDRRAPIRVLATSRDEAIELAADAIMSRDPSVRIGLAQLSTADLAVLTLSTADAFEPCRHVAAAGRLFAERIDASKARGQIGEAAVAHATAAFAATRPSRSERPSPQAPRGREEAEAPAWSERPARDPPVRAAAPSWDVYRSSTGTSVLVYDAPSAPP